jgi:hypothetical protein
MTVPFTASMQNDAALAAMSAIWLIGVYPAICEYHGCEFAQMSVTIHVLSSIWYADRIPAAGISNVLASAHVMVRFAPHPSVDSVALHVVDI